MDLVPLLVLSAGIVAVLAGTLSLFVRQPWRGLLWGIGFASGACFVIPVFLVGLSWLLLHHYPDTVPQARGIMEAHVAELTQLQQLVDAHPALCDAGARTRVAASICDDADPDAYRDPAYAADYAKAAKLLAAVKGDALTPERDAKTRALTALYFSLYEASALGLDDSIYAVWLAPGQDPNAFEFYYCEPTRARGWFACARTT